MVTLLKVIVRHLESMNVYSLLISCQLSASCSPIFYACRLSRILAVDFGTTCCRSDNEVARVKENLFETFLCSRGSSQECVLWPLFLVLYIFSTAVTAVVCLGQGL